MLVDPSNSGAGARVAGAIRQASQATGASFNYLLATAQVESGLDPQAGASTSSARGLFQFIEQTWLATMKQSGGALGYGRYADAIAQTASGRYEVTDQVVRNEILKLRNDPTANAVMAGAFTSTNAAELTQQLGRAPSEGELYIAHFLGSGGAARLIGIAASNPTAKATEFFAGAARANPSIFHDHATGASRSVAQVRDVLIGRYNAARAGQDPSLATAQAAVAPCSCRRARYGGHRQRLCGGHPRARGKRHTGLPRAVYGRRAPRRSRQWSKRFGGFPRGSHRATKLRRPRFRRPIWGSICSPTRRAAHEQRTYASGSVAGENLRKHAW
jgi:hypothetical protein